MSRSASFLLAVAMAVPPVAGISADCNRNGVDDLEDVVPRQVGFSTALPLDLDRLLWGFQLADLEADGALEVVLLSGGQYGQVFTKVPSVGILRRSRSGSLVLDEEAPVALPPVDSVVADLDGDGNPDLATVNREPYVFGGPVQVSVLRNRGDGHFEDLSSFPGGPGADKIVALDLDGDGDADLATADTQSSISLHSNLGGGAFGAAEPIAAGGMPTGLAAGDLDGDGHADIAVALTDTAHLQGELAVLRGRGAGTFEESTRLDGGVLVNSVELSDLDGDGDLDIVSGSNGSCCRPSREGDLRVFVNEGAGFFAAPLILDEGPGGAIAVTAADLNADGRLDLAAASNALGVVVFLRKDGVGFGDPVHYAAGPRPEVLRAGDLDGDGDLDLATVGDQGLLIFPNRGDGSFDGNLNLPAGPEEEQAEAVAAADLDGDGDPDLAVAGGGSNSLLAMLNDGQGRFSRGDRQTVGKRPRHLALGDLDGDGRIDIVTADYGEYYLCTGFSIGASVSIVMGLDGGRFAQAEVLAEGGTPSTVTLGDLDGDGRPDLATALGADFRTYDRISIRFNLGGARFSEPLQVEAGWAPTGIAAGDLDGDRDLDLVTANLRDRTISILLNEGTGSFRKSDDTPLGGSAYSVGIMDLNGDSVSDLAVDNSTGASIWTLLGLGGARFGPAQAVAVSGSNRLASGDFDRDGRLDLVTANGGDNVSLLLGDGEGGFAPELRFVAGPRCHGIAAADLDGDGDLDAVTANASGKGSVTILLNRTVPASSIDADRNSIPDECQAGRFHRGDSNSSGRIDVSDVLATLGFLYLGGTSPECLDAMDADDSGVLDLTDGLFTLAYLFGEERPPPPPGPPESDCGVDPDPEGSPGRLGCERYGPCAGT